jgi:Na+/phosphate symporter
MKKKKNLLAVAVVVACCVIAVWFSASIHGSQNTYELRPRLAIPKHKTDIVRVVDAYERLMERYLDLTERNSAMVGEDIRAIAIRLDSIDDRLSELSARTARIEQTLGIKQPEAPAKTPGQVETAPPAGESRIERPR